MWYLLIIVIGILLLHNSASEDIIAINGEDVDLRCNIANTNQQISKILCKSGDGTSLGCAGITACKNHTIGYSKGRKERIIRVLNIPNVSLDDEDEYNCTMTTGNNKIECMFNLTVNVPPTGLVLIDEYGEELPPNKISIGVAEGEKTIVCKTNTSVKPAVDLEWLVPEGLNVISEDGAHFQDERDERLFVSTRILSFTTNYTFDEDRSLVCKVAANSSLKHRDLQTSVSLKNKGETTVTTGNAWRSSTENQNLERNDGDIKGNKDVSNTPMTTVLISPAGDNKKELWPIIAGSSSVVILLLVLATVGIIVRSRKMAVRGHVKLESTRDATQPRPFQSRGSLPPPPSDQSSLTANHLPDRQSSPTRSFRPAPPVPQGDISMRQMVPVSDDTTGCTTDNHRLRGATSREASASRPAKHSQRGLDTDMEYDVLNDMEYDVLNMEYAVGDKTSSKAHGSVPHVYRETTDGLAEYALVSRPKMGKNALQLRKTEQQDAEFEYAVVDKSHRTERESVPHFYTQTMSGLEEYAVVNKPKDQKKRQSAVRHTTAPGDFEAEYAVVDKWQKTDRRIC